MNNKILSLKLEYGDVLDDAADFFYQVAGVNHSSVFNANVSFIKPTRLDNYYNKLLLLINGGLVFVDYIASSFGLSLDKLSLLNTYLILQQLVVIGYFPKSFQNYARYENFTNRISVSILQSSRQRMTSKLIHELTHYFSDKNEKVFSKKTHHYARAVEVLYLLWKNSIDNLNDAITLIEKLNPQNEYRIDYFKSGFDGDSQYRKSLRNLLFGIFSEDYDMGMYIAGKIFHDNIVKGNKIESISGILN